MNKISPKYLHYSVKYELYYVCLTNIIILFLGLNIRSKSGTNVFSTEKKKKKKKKRNENRIYQTKRVSKQLDWTGPNLALFLLHHRLFK